MNSKKNALLFLNAKCSVTPTASSPDSNETTSNVLGKFVNIPEDVKHHALPSNK